MKTSWLLFKNLLFTLCVPGVMIGWIPFHWFERHAHWPAAWLWPQFVGAGFFLPGLVLYLSSQWLFFSRGQGTPAPVDPPKRFVRRGPYKWVRNPMYLAVLTMVLGETVFVLSWHIGIYWICLGCVFHLFVLAYEENSLRYRFGALYEDYKRDVPRWLPRKPRPPLQTVAPFEIKR